MGVFVDYNGNMRIPEEKKKEFTGHVLKLLNYGGMMQLSEVCMSGHKIILLNPAEMDRDGESCFHFNYFEDGVWEKAGYRAESTSFFSGKIGGKEFCDVVTAVHFLYELYDEGAGFTEMNGEIVEGSLYIGWINQVLGTDFSLRKRFRLWDNFEKYCLERAENAYEEDEIAGSYEVLDTIPHSLIWAMGGAGLADICYVLYGTHTLEEEGLIAGSYPEAVYQCKVLLKRYFVRKGDEKEKIRRILDLVQRGRSDRENMRESDMRKIAQKSLTLPARVLIYLTGEITARSFWSLWKEVHENVYHDEIMPQYASDEVVMRRKAAADTPVEAVRTSVFLCDNGPFTFWNTPEELKGKPNYYLSDDDRAFWWDGSGEVILSKEMEGWLSGLTKRHRALVDEMPTENPGGKDITKELLSILEEIEARYKRVYCFRDMFYEFLQNGEDRRYLAAVRLLEELAEEYGEEGKIIEHVTGAWELASKNVTHNAGRMAMKRYLSVMANSKLREIYFGF